LAHTITPTQSTNYSATFAIEFHLTTEAAAGGTVTPASGWQARGAVVPLLASPAQDYRFLGWQGNGPGAYSGTNRATALTLHGPVTELATFAAIPPPPTATPSVSATNVVSPPEPTPAVAKELALLNAPAPEPLAKPAAARPPDVTPLLAEAQRHLAARKFDQAQDKYLEALRQDEKNVAALANLATLQLELNRLADAEGHFKQALALAPEDPTTLLNFGRLQFQQKKYAEARDALNHAAKLEPKNAKVQNLLGLVLMEQGARGPAEKAFRKAIELQPGYGNAHHNLAVLFLTQQPPFVEMARWHYQKALQLDAPRDPDLEKMLNPVQP
jgi:Flp pilus assembly protein TadD